MASVKVTLELDDRNYLARLQTAERETAKLGATAAAAGQAGAAGMTVLATATGAAQKAALALKTELAVLLAPLIALQTAFSAFTLADDISDIAAASEISAARVINLRNALEGAGGNAEDADRMIVKLTNSLYDATEMGSKAQKNLLQLGFTLDDIKTLTPEEAIIKTVNALAKMPDATTRNALAFELFGRNAGLIQWDNLSESVNNLTERQQRQGQVAEQLGGYYDDLRAGFNEFMLTVMELVAPIGEMIVGLGEVFSASGDAEGAINILKAAIAGLSIVVATIITGLAQLWTTLKGVSQVIYYALTGQFDKAKDAGRDMFDTILKQGQAWQKSMNRILNPQAPAASTGGGRANRTLTDQKADSERGRLAEKLARDLEKQRDAAVDLQIAIDAQTESMARKYETELQNIGLTQDQIRLNNELAALNEKQLKDISEINKLQLLSEEERAGYIAKVNEKYAAQEKTLKTNLGLISESNYLEKLRLLNVQDAIADKQEEIAQTYQLAELENLRLELTGERTSREAENVRQLLKLEGDFVSKKKTLQIQLDNAIEQIEKDRIKRELENLEQSYKNNKENVEKKQQLEEERRQNYVAGVKSVFEGIEDSITPFQVAIDATSSIFSNLENAISDFAKTGKFSFSDFAKSIIRDLIAISLRALILRTILGAIGGIFGGSAGTTTLPAIADTGIRFAAAGGPIKANQGYIVGEKGPEFFMPNTGGTMIPNHMLGGGGGTTVNYNINAVDAMSFKQMVARDPEFIYSVTQLGARRLPR